MSQWTENKVWSEAEITNAVEMWNLGMTLGEIADAHHCTHHGVSFLATATFQWMRDNPDHGDFLPPLDPASVVALVLEKDDA